MPIDLSGLFEDDDLSVLEDPDIPRIDLVDRAASGVPRFLIAKAADGARGLLSPDFVRDLVAKSEPPADDKGDTVTMTGSPAAVARFIHQAAVAKTHDTEDREHDDGNPPGPVAKETNVSDVDLDPMVVLAEPDTDMAGLPTNPGSPAWEAIDAATARKWTSILARAKGAVDLLADREMLEAASGDDPDSGMNAMDLQDACAAIDYAISVLAPFAVSEQAEADCCDEMAMVGKALGTFDATTLDTIEALGQVRKAGRVLSSANEAAIRGAVESLQKVLASLPAAPVAEDSGQPVAKSEESPMTEPAPADTATTTAAPAAEAAAAPAPAAAPVAKADDPVKPQMVAVYNAGGTLVGVVDPADITTIAGAEPKDEPDDEKDSDVAEPATDTQPAPAAEVGTPADAVPDGVTKTTAATSGDDSTTSDTSSDVLKSIADQIRAQLDSYSAAQQVTVAKMAADLAAAAETVETLKGQVKALEEQPAEPRVFTNGAVPPAHQMRGQDRGATPVDVAKAQELKKTLYQGTAQEQNRAFNDMQELAVAKLRELHQRPGAAPQT